MTEELDVLRIISERLRAAHVPFMLTGSFALGYYGKPRMTRDLDFVVAMMERHVDALVSAFSTDFYIDEDAARSAIKSQRMFNLMHLDSAIKVDLIVRKNSEYRQTEFERRKSVEFAGISTWITSREDLILSKLVWARDTGLEMQMRDVRALAHDAGSAHENRFLDVRDGASHHRVFAASQPVTQRAPPCVRQKVVRRRVAP